MSKFKLKEGVNNCSNEEYHGDKNYLSSSNLKLLLNDVSKFKKEFIDGERENRQVNAFDEGNYAHTLILEPDKVKSEYAFFSGFKKIGNEWKLFKENNSDKIILSKPQKHRVEKWVESYKKNKTAVEIISGGIAEHSVAGNLAGVPIKVRADYINIDKGYIADVKTTSYNCDLDTFRYVVKSLKYDLSAALYCKMFKEYYKKDFDFYFIVLGKRDIMCEVYKASLDTLNNGEVLIMEALSIYKKCLESGEWGTEKENKIVNYDNYEILEV